LLEGIAMRTLAGLSLALGLAAVGPATVAFAEQIPAGFNSAGPDRPP
jgi:hypothetical protein